MTTSSLRRLSRVISVALLLVVSPWNILHAQLAQVQEFNASGELRVVEVGAAGIAPVIVADPDSRTVQPGSSFSISVLAEGSGPLMYQWFKGVQPVPDATSPSLVLAEFAGTDAGEYTVVVTNGYGTATSAIAVLALPTSTDPFGPALGLPDLKWTSQGAIYWRTFEGASAHDGESAVGTGEVVWDDSSLETQLEGPATLRFWLRFPSSATSEMLVSLNGEVVRSFDNGSRYLRSQSDGQWHEQILHIPPGEWSLTFTHLKDGSVMLDDFVLTAPADSDEDGMSDDWEMEHFLNLAAEPGDDPDDDLNSNLVEYLDLTNPGDGDFSNEDAYRVRVHQVITGQGSVVITPEQGRFGYQPSWSGESVSITARAVADEGSVFMGWDFSHGVQYTPTYGFSLSWGSLNLHSLFATEVSLAEALDAPELLWTTGGDALWVGQTDWSFDGDDAALAGPLPSQGTETPPESWIETSLTGPLMVEYRANVSYLGVTVDGASTPVYTIAYESWLPQRIFIPPGTHTVRWTSKGNTRLGLDQVVLLPVTDTDGDGMPDEWENQYFGDLSRDGTGDLDGDGVSDPLEYARGTHPNSYTSVRRSLDLEVDGSGAIHANPAQALYDYEQVVMLTAVPEPGHQLERWFRGIAGEQFDRSETLSITISAGSQEFYHITARFGATLDEAVDLPGLGLEDSQKEWLARSSVSHDGADAAVFASDSASSSPEMSAVVEGPVVLSFWWKVSGEENAAALRLVATNPAAADQTLVIVGEVDWERRFVVLPPGVNTLTWTANDRDDISAFSSATSAWLDQISIAADTDQDGLGDDWEVEHFEGLSAGADADADEDGVSNQDEFGDGTDPNDEASVLYQLRLITSEPGSVAMNPQPGPFAPGTVVTLTAGASLTSWSGDASGVENPLLVTMDSSKEITATFDPLAASVDCVDLMWATGGDAPWVPAIGWIGEDRAERGEGLEAGQQSWIETTMTGPGILRFNASLSSAHFETYTPVSQLRWELNGTEVGDAASYSPDHILIPEGTHTVRWIFTAGEGEMQEPYYGAWLDQVIWEPFTDSVDLAEALDAPDLAWTTGGDSAWFGDTTSSHDGQDSAASWAVPNYGETWIETQVTGPSTLTYWCRTSVASGGLLQFSLDGNSVAGVPDRSGETGWVQVEVAIPLGVHIARWTYNANGVSNEADRVWVDQVAVTGGRVPLETALDAEDLSWEIDGAGWVGVAWEGAQDGVDTAISGAVGHEQSGGMQTEVTGPGELSFWWKVSSEEWSDYLSFTVDGAELPAVPAIAGEVGWTRVVINLSPGSHLLRWEYSKNYGYTSGQDLALVDEVQFVPTQILSLEESLDAPSLVWTSGGTANDPGRQVPAWMGVAASVASDGVDHAETTEVLHSEDAWVETEIVGPATLTFRWKVSSEANWDRLALHIDGFQTGMVQAISGEVDWKEETYEIPAGTHAVRWWFTRDGFGSGGANRAWLDQVTVTVPEVLSLEEALDTNGIAWSTGGDGDWNASTVGAYDNEDVARSATISDSQSSWLETTLNGPGTLRFWWKVSSEEGWDYLKFTVNGQSVAGVNDLSGEVAWSAVSIELGEGPQIVRWQYEKDEIFSSGNDAAWVDAVSFAPVSGDGFADWIAGSPFSGDDALPESMPFNDDITNLEKYAFNLPAHAPAAGAVLTPGTGTSGLPHVSVEGSGTNARLRVEYVRRRADPNLTYQVQVTSNLSPVMPFGWQLAVGSEIVTEIDAEWERVVVEDIALVGSGSNQFLRVEIEIISASSGG